jgi:hypothetical protein
MRSIFIALLGAAFVPAAFGTTAFADCTASGGSFVTTLADSNANNSNNVVNFLGANGNGSFACSDAGLGLGSIVSASIQIFTDYGNGNGADTDTNDNSAGFTFTNTATTWAAAMAGASTTTMTLNTPPGVGLFVIGNQDSNTDTFNNTTSDGFSGTAYTEPATEAISGTLLDTFTVNLSAFVDGGGFDSGASTARIVAEFQDAVPEPSSIVMGGIGLLALFLIARRRSLFPTRG